MPAPIPAYVGPSAGNDTGRLGEGRRLRRATTVVDVPAGTDVVTVLRARATRVAALIVNRGAGTAELGDDTDEALTAGDNTFPLAAGEKMRSPDPQAWRAASTAGCTLNVVELWTE